jgi:hypothetical protein
VADRAGEVLEVDVSDGKAGVGSVFELAVQRQELGVEDGDAARLAFDRASNVRQRRADAARDRLDPERQVVSLDSVCAGREELEVPLEVTVADRQLPEVEDEQARSEARQPTAPSYTRAGPAGGWPASGST